MSKADRHKKRQQRKRYAKPSLPRAIGANDNTPAAVNDNAPREIRGVKLTEGQAYRLGVAEARIASDDLANQRLGHLMLEALEQEIESRRVANDVEAGLVERRGLEALRGYRIGLSEIEGATGVPYLSRDGLETLLTAGSISKIEHAAGLMYRTDYERIDPERLLTPPQLDPEKIRVAHGGDNWDTKRREIEDRVFTIHLMICGVDAPTRDERRALPRLPAGHPAMRAIFALQEVAGKGANISDLASSGSVRARIREDLIFALEACGIVYGLE